MLTRTPRKVEGLPTSNAPPIDQTATALLIGAMVVLLMAFGFGIVVLDSKQPLHNFGENPPPHQDAREFVR